MEVWRIGQGWQERYITRWSETQQKRLCSIDNSILLSQQKAKGSHFTKTMRDQVNVNGMSSRNANGWALRLLFCNRKKSGKGGAC